MRSQRIPPPAKMPGTSSPPIYPVIIQVPQALQQLTGRAKVAALSRSARKALSVSAQKGGWPVNNLQKDANGAPIPENGVYWSVSHKTRFAAAVAAPYPVGIDIEAYQNFGESLKRRIASQKEWRLGTSIESNFLFLRFWTAKEAVLKAVGVGMTGLSRCRITAIIDAHHLCLAYDHTPFKVTQTQCCGHLAAVTTAHHPISWTHL